MQQVDLDLIGRQRQTLLGQRGVRDLHLPGREVADADGADLAGLGQLRHGSHLGAYREKPPAPIWI